MSEDPSRQSVASDGDLQLLIDILPARIQDALASPESRQDLIEIVMDLGRAPEARYPGRAVDVSKEPVTRTEIDRVISRIGYLSEDNRAGIERTLHRISVIRNRQGTPVGLTCRVGRAIYGTVEILRDVVESGRSVLLLGRPGVGKTTLLREAGRVLADQLGRRVIIVDTSNEIAGDGDIPHPGIGRARRMQVPTPARQHAVMIEAVENHMPEVIVIDEIGTEQEVFAARTIAERGVQLIATVHGNTLENLLLNPGLSDLVGGIQTVTLSDEEARRRMSRKTVLERRAPPTFDVVVELHTRDELAVHHGVADVVDRLLLGKSAPPQMRVRHPDGSVEHLGPTPAGSPHARETERVLRLLGNMLPPEPTRRSERGRRDRRAEPGSVREGGDRRRSRRSEGLEEEWESRRGRWSDEPGAPEPRRSRWSEGLEGVREYLPGRRRSDAEAMSEVWEQDESPDHVDSFERHARDAGRSSRDIDRPARDIDRPARDIDRPVRDDDPEAPIPTVRHEGRPIRVFPFAVSWEKLERAIDHIGANVLVTTNIQEADLVLTLKAQVRRNPQKLREAANLRIPIDTIRANTVAQMEQFVEETFGGRRDRREPHRAAR